MILPTSLVAAVAASIAWPPPPLLVWNSSSSAPVGLYSVVPGRRLARGDMVLAWTPEPSRTLAAARGYLPSNVPLVKRIAAAAGDRVCALGSSVFINGRRASGRRETDGRGRPMPWWTGCRTLRAQEYFLLMDSWASFDGRYFGPTAGDQIIGKVLPLWT